MSNPHPEAPKHPTGLVYTSEHFGGVYILKEYCDWWKEQALWFAKHPMATSFAIDAGERAKDDLLGDVREAGSRLAALERAK